RRTAHFQRSGEHDPEDIWPTACGDGSTGFCPDPVFLTPSRFLSEGERGPEGWERGPFMGRCKWVGGLGRPGRVLSGSRQNGLPLPWGEGRGEGTRCAPTASWSLSCDVSPQSPQNILHVNDRVIDHHADRYGQAAEGHRVDG